jgi:hypothetical protein
MIEEKRCNVVRICHVVVMLMAIALISTGLVRPSAGDAGSGVVAPKERDVLVCRGKCATNGMGCGVDCRNNKPLFQQAECIEDCHAAMNRCYVGCGTYPGDTKPEPPKVVP